MPGRSMPMIRSPCSSAYARASKRDLPPRTRRPVHPHDRRAGVRAVLGEAQPSAVTDRDGALQGRAAGLLAVQHGAESDMAREQRDVRRPKVRRMSSSSLEVPRRQQPEKRSKLWRILVILATLAVAVGWLIWFLRTPDDLPTDRRPRDRIGRRRPDRLHRHVRRRRRLRPHHHGSPRSRSTSRPDDDVEVTPLICRGGSLSFTTDAASVLPRARRARRRRVLATATPSCWRSPPPTADRGRDRPARDLVPRRHPVGHQGGRPRRAPPSPSPTTTPGTVDETPSRRTPPPSDPSSDDPEKPGDKKGNKGRDKEKRPPGATPDRSGVLSRRARFSSAAARSAASVISSRRWRWCGGTS